MKKNEAVCLVHAEMFADMLIFEKEGKPRGEARAALRRNNIDPDDSYEIDDAYTELVETLATEHLPEPWGSTHDYWGGKCFARSPGWSAPTEGTVLAGESGRYMCSTDPQAIIDAMRRGVKETVE